MHNNAQSSKMTIIFELLKSAKYQSSLTCQKSANWALAKWPISEYISSYKEAANFKFEEQLYLLKEIL